MKHCAHRRQTEPGHTVLRHITLALLACFLLAWPNIALAEGPYLPDLEYRERRPKAWLTEKVGKVAAPAEIMERLPSGPVDFSHYPSYAEVRQFCAQLATDYPNLVSLYSVGRSWQGRELFILRLGNKTNGDPDSRPALYLDGQHHAREAISQQVALYFAWWLLHNFATDPVVAHLLDTRTVYLFPMVNPDGNEAWLMTDAWQRRTVSPACDDDGDGRIDEDPPDHAGYGSYQRFIYRFNAAWVAEHEDDILAPGWESHLLASTYLGLYGPDGQLRTQYDNDGDRRFNEDPLGGVDANRNYDLHWELGSRDMASETFRGPQPFSEPETRAVRDFVLNRPNIAVGVSLHSGTDMILYPWAWTSGMRSLAYPVLDEIAYKGSQLTTRNGYRGSRYGQGGVILYRASGTAGDWLHSQTLYSWTPEVFGGSGYLFAERIGTSNEYEVGIDPAGLFCPPVEEIVPLADRWRHFLLYVLAATPNVGFTSVITEGAGLALEIANDGYIPTHVTCSATTSVGEVFSTTWYDARAGRYWVNVPYSIAVSSEVMTMTLTSTIMIGEQTRTLEQERLLVHISTGAQGQPTIRIEGRLMPWIDLGRACGDGSWGVQQSACYFPYMLSAR